MNKGFKGMCGRLVTVILGTLKTYCISDTTGTVLIISEKHVPGG